MSEQGQLRSAPPHAVPPLRTAWLTDRESTSSWIMSGRITWCWSTLPPAPESPSWSAAGRADALPQPVGWVTCNSIADRPDVLLELGRQLVGPGRRHPGTLELLDIGRRPATRPSMACIRWVNDLPDGSALVFDDLHAVASSAFHADLQYVIDQLPSSLTLVLVTRSDPPIALHRVRLEERLLDLRARDLAFTRAETHDLLVSHGLDLDPTELDLLHDRTEGWAAGLRLAIISMAQSEDSADVLRRPGGMTEAVNGYLAEEVLSQLAPPIVSCCSTPVSWTSSPPRWPESLDRAARRIRRPRADHRPDRLPVSDRPRRAGYRYQPMFAEVLRAQLAQANPVKFAEQHRRAAHWFQMAQDTASTVRHAQCGG